MERLIQELRLSILLFDVPRVSGSFQLGNSLSTIVRLAQTVALLLGHRAISPNGVHPPGSGTTPLHLAASLGRVDIVNLLLEQDTVDDSLRDANRKTCRDVARSKDVVKAIDGMFPRELSIIYVLIIFW